MATTLVPGRDARANMSFQANGRVILTATVEGAADDASRERIRQLFHSPLGVYVSHASRGHDSLRLEFDVASVDLDFTVRTLRRVLPEAVVERIRPRVFAHPHRSTQYGR